METKDKNGTVLNEGDSVKVVKDLKIKGSSSKVKRGTVVKNIRLTGSPEEIDCRVNKMDVVLKTCFVQKI